jgi:hypothetical protein
MAEALGGAFWCKGKTSVLVLSPSKSGADAVGQLFPHWGTFPRRKGTRGFRRKEAC